MAKAPKTSSRASFDGDPYWYKQAIIYQCHVRAFADSDGDGIGDFRGLTSRLSYLQDLGITAIWLLPFYPSPLRDDGYDIADYYSIHSSYGTLADFKKFLREAHARNIRVITELVINHTSDQHPWFQKSRRAKPGTKSREFYVWNDDDEKYKEARIIFKDFETSNWAWDSIGNAYYWHRFYSHQPDLNFENEEVHKEIFKIMDFWLDMGVDGLRLDAVPYLYEQEGTNCENLPRTHAYLKKLRTHVDKKYGDRMLIAEANQWPEDAVEYFGSKKGDECHVAFHFPIMPRLFMATRMEDRVPIVDIMEQTPEIPETGQWAVFLRNHDELTLEMVTDEERDYMYRMYAEDPKARINLGIRRRLAPLLRNDRKRIELLNALLLSLPGTPIVYYGDEIGMGDNIFLGDRNGVRTPMQWSSDKNAGFSRCNPQGLYLPVIVDPEYHFETVNVEAHEGNPHSLLWWTKRLLAARKRLKAFGEGTIEFLHPENRKILVYIRRYEDETILVAANLSRFAQPVELDLSEFEGRQPVELFGRTPFPLIGELPYFLTLGPHAFYWFKLEKPGVGAIVGATADDPLAGRLITVKSNWEEVFRDLKARAAFEGILQKYMRERRWFAGKAREIKSVSIWRNVPVTSRGDRAFLVIVSVDYVHEEPETYLLPLAFLPGAKPDLIDETPLAICRVEFKESGRSGLICDATASHDFCRTLLSSIRRRRTFSDVDIDVTATPTPALRQIPSDELEPRVAGVEQSNTAILFGDRLLLKLFRKIETGLNPDLEISRFLAERNFPYSPALAGSLEARTGPKGKNVASIGIMTQFISNSQDAWEFTLDILGRFFERIQSQTAGAHPEAPRFESSLDIAERQIDSSIIDILGPYTEPLRLLGERTGALHLTLASEPEDPDFAPEAFTPFYQRSLYQSMRNLCVQNFQLLRRQLSTLPPETVSLAETVLEREKDILRVFRRITDHPIETVRIRCHGDFHLGQVLWTGKDFFIFDFEGEPARSLGERRLKRPATRDLGGMLRSFDYATHTALVKHADLGNVPPEKMHQFDPWALAWRHCAEAVFLHGYFRTIGDSSLVPADKADRRLLLESALLEKAIYELSYELNNRPAWLAIPLSGILDLLEP